MSIKCTKNRQTCIVPQYHESVAQARKALRKMANDPHSSWNKDFGNHIITKIILSKKGPYGGPNVEKNGRRLYNIHIRKRKERK